MIFLNFIVQSFVTFIVIACYLITISFTIWMMIDAGKQDRFWWLTLIIGIPVVGAAVYYFSEKKHEYVKVSPHRLHMSETEEQHEVSPKKKHGKKTKKESVEGNDVVKQEEKQEEIQETVVGEKIEEVVVQKMEETVAISEENSK